MKIRPLNDRILLRRVEARDRTAGGLYLPETAKEKPLEAEVLAVPEKIGKRKPVVSAGDHVILGKYVGDEIAVDGEELLLVQEQDLLAVLE